MTHDSITLKGVRVHNLKNIDISIPKNKLVVITGLSGSGKSSLAFDTIYAEGQRRYVESLSSYARQFLNLMDKPDVDVIEGLSPTIAIDQHSVTHNPRSTVGTVTEVYDFLRLLYARAGHPHCNRCGQRLSKMTLDSIAKKIASMAHASDVAVMVPLVFEKKNDFSAIVSELSNNGYEWIRVNGDIMSVPDAKSKVIRDFDHTLDIVFQKIKGEAIADLAYKDLLTGLKVALDLGDGFVSCRDLKSGQERFFSLYYACRNCQWRLLSLEPRSFSFNSPDGACEKCSGLGICLVVDPLLVMQNERLSISQGAVRPWVKLYAQKNGQLNALEEKLEYIGIRTDVPVMQFSDQEMKWLLHGKKDFQGIIAELEEKHKTTASEYVRKEMESYMREQTCPRCKGKRLKDEILKVTISQKSIADIVNIPIHRLLMELEDLGDSKKDDGFEKHEQKISFPIKREIIKRLKYLSEVGLGYLTLDRPATTLSGGEAQRIRLATQIGSLLCGVIYVLDEPSIGLHPVDNDKLIANLKHLRDMGNTVIVIEHDASTIEAADHIIDMGPGAGIFGGKVIASGTGEEIRNNPSSLTGQYLSGEKSISRISQLRKGNGKFLSVLGASAYNLKNIDVHIPLGTFVCFTGVSGSGKSTLLIDILAKSLNAFFYHAKEIPAKHREIAGKEHIDKIIHIDQSPIGRTPRSNPATYTGVFTTIRDIFVEVPESRIKGYSAGHFSFNVKGGGRCEHCQGEGMVRISMQFLQDVYVVCEECKGKRYHKQALEVYYKGKNIADVLSMNIMEAREFFRDIPVIHEKLHTLDEVGLGYLQLGQSATTLSGGEAQRMKLASELSRRDTGRTLYILDEPTTGLHFDDVKKLLIVLDKLVEKGNTVITIEHNLDIMKCADWIIDIGPGGGDEGGHVVAIGTPEEVAKNKDSFTARYLRKVL